METRFLPKRRKWETEQFFPVMECVWMTRWSRTNSPAPVTLLFFFNIIQLSRYFKCQILLALSDPLSTVDCNCWMFAFILRYWSLWSLRCRFLTCHNKFNLERLLHVIKQKWEKIFDHKFLFLLVRRQESCWNIYQK